MARHTRSHTVPRFYLRAFAEDGHVAAFTRGRARRLGIRVASVEPDIYALREQSGALYQGLEQRFAEVERLAAKAHRTLRQGQLPSSVEWLHYLLYLGLAVGRTRRGWHMSVNAMPPELLALAPIGSDEHRRIYLQSLVTRLWPRCVWLFGQLDVRLTPVPEDLALVTADHPVGFWTDQPEAVEGLGLMSAPLLVHPIDRRHALWFKKPMDPWPGWLNDPWCVVANANWAMTRVATREVFAHPRDAGRLLLWLPDGRTPTPLGRAIPVARTLPLWLPGESRRPDRTAEELEAALARSPRSRALAFIAHASGLEPSTVLAVQMPQKFGPYAALIRRERGFATMTGLITRKTQGQRVPSPDRQREG